MFGAKTRTGLSNLSGHPNWHAGPSPGRKRVNLEGRLVALFPSPWLLQGRHLAEGSLRPRVWIMSTARFWVSAQRHRLGGFHRGGSLQSWWMVAGVGGRVRGRPGTQLDPIWLELSGMGEEMAWLFENCCDTKGNSIWTRLLAALLFPKHETLAEIPHPP